MRYQTEEKGEYTYLLGEFLSGETVTITLYDLSSGAAVALDSDSCLEVGSTGWFCWASDNITTPANSKTEYLYIMTDSGGYTYSGKFIVGGYPDSNALETTAQAIKSKTDNIPTDPASESGVQSMIDGLNDISTSEVDGIISANAKISEIRDKTHTIWQKVPMDYMMGSSLKISVNGDIAAILADTDELQRNQGNWLTASGFATQNPPSQNLDDYKADVSNLDVAVSSRSSHSAADVWSENQAKYMLGLMQHNFRLKDQVYSNNKLVSAVLRIYNSAADTENDINFLKEYHIAASYDGDGNCISYKVTEV